jgi:serine/alanine adding enzyme
VRVVRSLEETIWRRFVDEHPQGNIFHTPEMFQVFAQAKNHRPTLWAVTDDEAGVLALLLPVQITLLPQAGILSRLTRRAIVYGSVLCAPGPQGHQALATLLQAYNQAAKGNVLFTELRNLTDVNGLQSVLVDHDFAYEEHLNYLIDLDRPAEEVMQSIGSRTRKNIRRGLRKEQVAIEEIHQPEQVVTCYELLAQTYAQAQVPLADRSLFEAAFQVLYPRGMVRFVLARVEDVYAATSIELAYKDVLYGWYGGMDRDYSSYVPNELLVWDILSWGVENGFRLYDFGGAGKPDEDYGVRDFKAKFGGELVCFGRNTHVHSPTLLQFSKTGYAFYRRLLKR